jgi:hypothetical protein
MTGVYQVSEMLCMWTVENIWSNSYIINRPLLQTIQQPLLTINPFEHSGYEDRVPLGCDTVVCGLDPEDFTRLHGVTVHNLNCQFCGNLKPWNISYMYVLL